MACCMYQPVPSLFIAFQIGYRCMCTEIFRFAPVFLSKCKINVFCGMLKHSHSNTASSTSSRRQRTEIEIDFHDAWNNGGVSPIAQNSTPIEFYAQQNNGTTTNYFEFGWFAYHTSLKWIECSRNECCSRWMRKKIAAFYAIASFIYILKFIHFYLVPDLFITCSNVSGDSITKSKSDIFIFFKSGMRKTTKKICINTNVKECIAVALLLSHFLMHCFCNFTFRIFFRGVVSCCHRQRFFLCQLF